MFCFNLSFPTFAITCLTEDWTLLELRYINDFKYSWKTCFYSTILIGNLLLFYALLKIVHYFKISAKGKWVKIRLTEKREEASCSGRILFIFLYFILSDKGSRLLSWQRISTQPPPAAMKTPSWKKWICILSNFIASISSRSICQTCATILGVEFLWTLSMLKKRKENLSSYVHVLHKESRKEVLHRSRAKSM